MFLDFYSLSHKCLTRTGLPYPFLNWSESNICMIVDKNIKTIDNDIFGFLPLFLSSVLISIDSWNLQLAWAGDGRANFYDIFH